MKESKPTVVDLKRDHLVAWFGDDGNQPTVKGKAAILDDEVIGVGGLAHVAGHWFAFTDLKPEAKRYKVFLHRTVSRYLAGQRGRHKRIFASEDGKEPTAEKWLSRLGFKPEQSGVWVWRD